MTFRMNLLVKTTYDDDLDTGQLDKQPPGDERMKWRGETIRVNK